MSTATIIALLEALIGFVGQIPALVSATQTAIDLLRTGVAPTVEQQARIDAALEAANVTLQAS
jgi:hypothetical protein